MTWRDVMIILQGLKAWYESEGKWVGCLFYVRHEERGELGDGFLEPEEEQEGDFDGKGKGEEDVIV